MAIPSLLRRSRESRDHSSGDTSRNRRREVLSGSLTVNDASLLTTSGITVDSNSDSSIRSHSHSSELHAQQAQRPLQTFDDDLAHADPSLWIDIVPPADVNNDTEDTRTSTSSSRDRAYRLGDICGPTTIKIPIPSLLCDFVTFFFEWTFAAVDVWADILSAPPFPLETLQKVSIVLLGVDRIRDNLDHAALVVLIHPTAVGSTGNMAMASIPHYLVWGVPGLVAILSVSFVLTLQLSWGHQEEAVIATALILLIFLEALLPLFILGCASMFLFQQVSWETGLVLLILVWLGSTFCAHCIRRMLYQSLGHG
jgi:hypothetical protein